MANDSTLRKRTGLKILIVVATALVVGAAIFYGYFNKQYQARKAKDAHATFIKPRVELHQLHFKRFDGKDTRLDIALKIHNPSPIGIRVDSLRYTLFMAGKQIAESRNIDSATIKSEDSTMVTLKLQINNDEHKAAFAKATAGGNDSTVYELRANVYLDLPFLHGKPIPYTVVKTLPAFMLPHVIMEKVHVDKTGLKKTAFTLNTRIVNPNSFPMRFKDGRYIFVIGGDTLKTGTVDGVVNVAPHDSTALNIPIEMKTGKALKTATALLLKPDETTYYYFFESHMMSKSPAMEEATAVTEARGKLSDLKKK